jgi:putative DNA primase/helicase
MTLLTKENNKALHRKCYGYANGQLVKKKQYTPAITNARVVAYTLEELAEIIKTDVVVIMGTPQEVTAGTNLTLLSRDAFKYYFPDHVTPPFVATLNGQIGSTRTLDTYVKNRTATLDYDATDATPEHMRFDTPQKLMEYLAQTVHPDFSRISYVASYSASAGIFAPDSTQLRDLSRMHIYFDISDAEQMSRLKSFLEAKLVLSESFWCEENKNGDEIVKLLIDIPVISAERYIFESRPELRNGLYQNKPQAFFYQGDLDCFDTSVLPADLEPAQIKKIAKIYQLPEKTATSIGAVTGIQRDFVTLQFDTPITLTTGEIFTVQELEAKLANGFDSTIPCHSPFRDDENSSCFVKLNKQKRLFMHDSATKTTYFCAPKPLPVQPMNVPLPLDTFADVRGKIPSLTRANVEILLNSYGCKVRYNAMSRLNTFDLPGVANLTADNEQTIHLSQIQDLCVRNGMACDHKRLLGILTEIGDSNRFHPVKDWILEKQWDGIDRLTDLINTIQVPDSYLEFRDIVIPKFLNSIVNVAMSDNPVKCEFVLIFSGSQGIGKSTWFKNLLPDDGCVLDGHKLQVRDKDSILAAVSHILVELGELEQTFRSSSDSELKAFLSKTKDVIRLPYATRDSHFQRRTVFVGSVNQPEFLRDITGNRRYWVLETLAVDYQHKIDMQQVFAQVYEQFYLENAPLHLTPAQEFLQQQLTSRHEEAEPLVLALESTFDFTQPSQSQMSVSQILQLMGMTADRANVTRLGIILSRKMQVPSVNGANHTKLYLMPPSYLGLA